MNTLGDVRTFRLGIIAAITTMIGTLFSGPLAFLAVSWIKPQPAWSGAEMYVANYHPIQSVTFYFGFLLLFGSVLMIACIYLLDRRKAKSLLALVSTSIACGLISFNYFTEATLIPALVRNYSRTLDPIVTLFAVTNPSSLFWAVEMWGYGFLGLGTWLAGGVLSGDGVEKAARILFTVNGIASVVGAIYTGIHLEWVLSTAGLLSYGAWNGLYLVLALLFLLVMLRRRSSLGTIQS